MPEEKMLGTELVGLKFNTDSDFDQGLKLYVERRPGGDFSSVGQNTIIIARKHLARLIDDLQNHQVLYSTFPVRSMGELSPDEAADLRRRRFEALSNDGA